MDWIAKLSSEPDTVEPRNIMFGGQKRDGISLPEHCGPRCSKQEKRRTSSPFGQKKIVVIKADAEPGTPAQDVDYTGIHGTKSDDPDWYSPQQGRASKPKKPLPPSCKKAVNWLLEHKRQLYQHGWTPGQLFRRNKSHGLAWLQIWGKPDLEVSITVNGAIEFTFPDARGKRIRQTARPQGGMAHGPS